MNPHKLTIVEAHDKLKKKEIKCVDLVRACLGQIHDHDEKIHAFLTVCKESALREAEEVDRKIERGEEIGILCGVPYSVKDVILTEDVKATAGSKMLEDFIAPYDATVIARLRKAGAILIGKTNCDAYGHGSSTENSDFGTTKNPWDTERIAGGSSGGSAASVAMDMCLFSLGEDTGGSIRQPSAMCGVTGLKTSYGRVSRYGSIAYASSLDSIGPIAKTVEDIEIVLECIAGYDERDHTTSKSGLKEIQTKDKKLTIGIPIEYFSDDLNTKMKKAMLDAIGEFRKLGYEIKDISLPHTKYSIATYYIIACAETSTNLERLDGIRYGHRAEHTKDLEDFYKKSRGEGFGAEVKRRIMMGTYVLSAGYFDAYYKKAQKVRTLIRKDFDEAFKECDIILSPTSPFTAFKFGEKANDPLAMYLADIYTIGFSLAGLPTISVPAGFMDGLPVGMQLTGNYLDESAVLSTARDYQAVAAFHKKKAYEVTK